METRPLRERIKQAIGDEPVAAFARRCGIGESLLRKYLQGSEPSASNLVKIATAASVSLDWLATGQGPRSRLNVSNQAVSAAAGTAPSAPEGPYARRLAAIVGLLEAMPAQESAALLDDFFSRAHQASELAELKRAVARLSADLKKSA
ncbi:MAG: helix-turn-helix domain-containing protein [Pseudomonadota bacterium]|jgi:transcriptional regulator with XRE-family HTH domain